MNHFFLPSTMPLTKGNTGLRVFQKIKEKLHSVMLSEM